MRRLKTFFILGALAITANWAQATMELPALIGDHMVFQAGKPAVVWGKDQPGQKITLSMNGQSASTQADKKGPVENQPSRLYPRRALPIGH